MSYESFLQSKRRVDPPTGLDQAPDLKASPLYDFQQAITRWALLRGRAAIFADCGLGKTPMQLLWAEHVPGRVLILAPLAVAQQTIREAERFGINVEFCRTGKSKARIVITNYEHAKKWKLSDFTGLVLDESSILKSQDGKFRTWILEAARRIPFRLACTATPAPNDWTELGNHAEFLGVCSRTEMLSTFFFHDGGDTSKWILKGHAREDFFRWLASWSIYIRRPSDLGFDDDRFELPPLEIEQHTVEQEAPSEGDLFVVEARSLTERRAARKATIEERVSLAAELADHDEPVVIWCGLNAESQALTEAISGAVEVAGSHSIERKEEALNAFTQGKIRVLVTKPSIAGFGLNWQHCHRQIFVGLSDSWESWYQAVRRCWRFGQTSTVRVDVVTADSEGAVVRNIERKEHQATELAESLVASMRNHSRAEVVGMVKEEDAYVEDYEGGRGWEMHRGDCVEVLRRMEPDSIGYSIFSPPFASLYTYSNSPRDLGNCSDDQEFFDHMRMVSDELFRVLEPGRNLSFHCMLLPTSKARDGEIGLHDFRGDLIRLFRDSGFIFHSEVVIWKDPVTAMQRTKALGLLWKQIKKDSTMSRQGVPDYLITMRKPGVNANPVSHTAEEFPVEQWQRWASPVWMDINPSDTLQHRSAREHDDERHICPLQLGVIRRALNLWSNPGDRVLSPFAGIGSEGVVSVEESRRFVGIELKGSYYDQAVANLRTAHHEQPTLFEESA